MSVKRYSHLVGVAAGMVLTLALSACQGLFQVPKPPVEATGTGEILEALPGTSQQVTVRLAQGVEGAEVYLRLSDPCAQGKAVCPGWDTTRYPGVEHTREAFTLTASNPEATFRFHVAQDALPQGPFKWELVAQDPSGREWTQPIYLRIMNPKDTPPLEAINTWRRMVGVDPFSREDLERSFGCWQFARYAAKNQDNPDPPHTTNPNKPFYTPAADECARKSNTGVGWEAAGRLADNLIERYNALFVALPLHRPWLIAAYASSQTYWYGHFSEWQERNGHTYLGTHIGMGLSRNGAISREILFPPRDTEVPLKLMWAEWPDPIEACNATSAPKLPYKNSSETWTIPAGLPITVMTSAPFSQVETEATYARLTRTRDGVVLPVCAFGSQQFWNGDQRATDTAGWILRNFGMLVLVPKDPLGAGEEYEVELKGLFGGQEKSYKWRFKVAQNPYF
ncbi:MAG: hypothetical protein P3W93_010960 [Thermus sp.]|nr:hypothetical protein [Thermus sp.]